MADLVTQADVIVLGSGIAGLSVADAVRQRDKSCVVVDPNPPGSGASAAPAMLINPAAGKRAKKTWESGSAFEAITGLMERVERHTGEKFYELKGVIRPALTEKMAVDFQKSPTKYDWEKGRLKWMERGQFGSTFPYLLNPYGGLFIEQAGTVDGQLFNKSLIRYLEDHEVGFLFGQSPDISKVNHLWQLTTEKGSYQSPVLIDASGASQAVSQWWDRLPLHQVKGQTTTYTFTQPLPLDASVSGMGYLAFLSYKPFVLTAGSTYEHHFEYTDPDQGGLEKNQKKLTRMLPGITDTIESATQWSAVRVTLPDRQPVIGEHPGQKNLYIIGALGSKGLLMGRYLAEMLVSHIITGTEIPEKVSVQRYL